MAKKKKGSSTKGKDTEENKAQGNVKAKPNVKAKAKGRKISGVSGEPAPEVKSKPTDSDTKVSKARGRKNQKTRPVPGNDAHQGNQSVSNGNIPFPAQAQAAQPAPQLRYFNYSTTYTLTFLKCFGSELHHFADCRPIPNENRSMLGKLLP